MSSFLSIFPPFFLSFFLSFFPHFLPFILSSFLSFLLSFFRSFFLSSFLSLFLSFFFPPFFLSFFLTKGGKKERKQTKKAISSNCKNQKKRNQLFVKSLVTSGEAVGAARKARLSRQKLTALTARRRNKLGHLARQNFRRGSSTGRLFLLMTILQIYSSFLPSSLPSFLPNIFYIIQKIFKKSVPYPAPVYPPGKSGAARPTVPSTPDTCQPARAARPAGRRHSWRGAARRPAARRDAPQPRSTGGPWRPARGPAPASFAAGAPFAPPPGAAGCCGAAGFPAGLCAAWPLSVRWVVDINECSLFSLLFIHRCARLDGQGGINPENSKIGLPVPKIGKF